MSIIKLLNIKKKSFKLYRKYYILLILKKNDEKLSNIENDFEVIEDNTLNNITKTLELLNKNLLIVYKLIYFTARILINYIYLIANDAYKNNEAKISLLIFDITNPSTSFVKIDTIHDNKIGLIRKIVQLSLDTIYI